MNCPACQAALPADAAFCGHCGNALPSDHACARCGKANAPDMRSSAWRTARGAAAMNLLGVVREVRRHFEQLRRRPVLEALRD